MIILTTMLTMVGYWLSMGAFIAAIMCLFLFFAYILGEVIDSLTS